MSASLLTDAAIAPKLVPAPGIYPNIPNSVYHGQWDAASNSQLTKLHQSPAHLKAYLDEPQKSTPALLMGSAIHTAILEPDDFTSRYVRLPKLDLRTKEGKAVRAGLELQYGPDNVLAEGDYDTCIKVRDSVLVHSSAAKLLAGLSHRELSIVWIDPATGLTCKARLDGLNPGTAGGVIIDIKSTKDASRREFEKSIFNYGYHRQGAFYLDGTAEHEMDVSHYVIIAAEKEGPCAVAAYRLTEGAIDAGGEQLRPLLATYKQCTETNTWPGYPDEVRDIALPAWAWGQIDDENKERTEATS